nr:transcription factor MYB44-like isoform X2 [Ipomoea batatas]
METPSSSTAAADPVTSLSLSLPGSNEAPPLINRCNHLNSTPIASAKLPVRHPTVASNGGEASLQPGVLGRVADNGLCTQAEAIQNAAAPPQPSHQKLNYLKKIEEAVSTGIELPLVELESRGSYTGWFLFLACGFDRGDTSLSTATSIFSQDDGGDPKRSARCSMLISVGANVYLKYFRATNGPIPTATIS